MTYNKKANIVLEKLLETLKTMSLT